MPYITKKAATFLREKTQNPNNKNLFDYYVPNYGELNYLFTKEFIRIWNIKSKYSTLHCIGQVLYDFTNKRDLFECYAGFHIREHTEFEGLAKLFKYLYLLCVSNTDIEIAADEALHEFRRRVITPYEEKKRLDPNNVDPYEEILINENDSL